MTTKDTSGGAFPFSPNDHSTAHMTTSGMSLRDWFAGQALAGINANPTWDENGWVDRARAAYEAADAMLSARQVQP